MTKSTITRERLAKIKSWRETYGAGSNVMLPAEEAEELARIALAAMDSEPVAWIHEDELPDGYPYDAMFPFSKVDIVRMFPVFAPQPPLVPDEAIWTCDPRKRGEFYTQEECNAWNACRAAMLQAGNSPVIPESCSAQFGNFQHYWHSKGYVMVPKEPTEAMCDISHIGVDVYCGITDDNEYYSIGGAEAAKVWKAMLAAAPQEGKQ